MTMMTMRPARSPFAGLLADVQPLGRPPSSDARSSGIRTMIEHHRPTPRGERLDMTLHDGLNLARHAHREVIS